MAKFKVGDKVKALRTGSFGIVAGNTYTVKEVDVDTLMRLVETGEWWQRPHDFELCEEPLPVWVNTPETPERLHPHYYKDFGAYLDQETGQVLVDVYAVIDEFGVTYPELQHLAKKALCTGVRGHKDLATDLDDIIDSALRLKERLRLKEEYK